MSKNVLIVSYYFPPGGGVGSFRAAKFVKYLRGFDWTPYVVSLPPDRQSKFLSDDLDNDQYASITEIPEETNHVDVTGIAASKPLGGIRWLPSLSRALPKIIETHEIDVVLHTGSPFLPLLCSTWVRHRTDVPYILDLRDPWYVDKELFENTKSVANPIWNWINKISEQKALKYSDRVILNTPRMESLYNVQYPEFTHKFTTITNGFDPSDYDYTAADPFEGVRIVHPGRFRRKTEGLLKALEQTTRREPAIELVHFGRLDYRHTERFYNEAERLGIRDKIDARGYTELESIVSTIKSADIGLVVSRPGDPTHIPTKIYDYIACDIPVLALDTPDGALTQIIEQFDHAYCASHDDVQRIIEILDVLIETQPQTLGSEEQRKKYTRHHLTGNLAQVLEESIEVSGRI
ncbi:glycosyltransferase [Natronosalvus vescus]|uniref:glycosyltransferase n=1 Tax=Natronosalvus vescus TaxID=2953881 RepID=UPI0020907145|nr:glycosyltransferase [Natronosalvus vescus]